MRCRTLVACSLLALVSCQGTLGEPSGSGGDDDDGDGCVGCTPSGIQVAPSTRVPRLSHQQWENTVQSLFYLDAPTGFAAGFAADPLGGKTFDNNAEALEIGTALWSDYQRAAEDVATLVVGDPALLAKIAPATLPTEPAARRDAFLAAFGARAYRRALDADDTARLTGIFDLGATHYPEMDAFTAGVRLTIEAVLQSPFFLYRPELGSSEEDLVALSDFEMASRLSYALWNTMPDDLLFEAAARGDLTETDTLETEIDRLLQDPRSRETFARFFDQVSHGAEYEQLDKSDTLYPSFDANTGVEMRGELSRFVTHVVESEGSLSDLLLDRTTFVTPALAEIYGIDPGTLTFGEDGYAEVTLDTAQRAGLLTRSGFLAWRGTPAQPDTILRGVFVAKHVLCASLGDPPDEAAGATFGDQVTNRQRVEALTGEGTCGASCHGQVINPLGFAFEHYGAAGEWRDLDSGQPIDASASFTFNGQATSYQNAVELSELIASSQSAHQCFAGAWIEFTMARDLTPEDADLAELVGGDSLAGASVRDMLRGLLSSDAFRYRRTEAAASEEVQP